MAGFIVILTLLLSFTPSLHSTTTATSATTNLLHHYRRILHHPLFPVDDSLPPSPSPQPEAQSQQPKYPFSSQSPPKQFFPNYPSPPPPPPPPTAVATFPANISSLILPQSSSSSKPISRKLVAVAVSVSLLSIALIAAIAAFLLHYHTKYHPGSSFFSDKDTTRTDSLRLFPPNTATSDGVLKPPPYRNVASTSSEFLYLGTLVSSREVDEGINRKASNPSNAGTASVSGYQRLGSPELHPLPPLSRHNFRANNRNADMGSSDDDRDNEEEEFFSPRGSPPAEKYSPTHAGSSSRREFEAVQGENFKSRSFNSNPYSNSASSTHSMSTSPSIPLNLSPSSLRSKSPDSVVNFPSPSKPISPPQPPQERTSQSPFSGDTQNSPARKSVISGLNQLSPPRKPSDSGQYAPVKLPPPPPPLPPPRFWEVPFLHMRIRDPVIGPPELVTPSRPIVLGGETQNSGTMERNDELSKPKLKPLHWDKVRASSDRAMVWDQLKSSSFQLNEEMIETLFMVNSSNFTPKDSNNRPPTGPSWNQENQVLDPKKSQNIAILLRALNVTVDEVCEALLEGNTDTLGTELLESLLKMAPTKEEERKLKDFKEESSPFKLGTAEKFLKAVLDIPFAFKRVDAMLYIANFDSEVEYLIKSFETLEAACRELKNSRMFLKLLETVLKTGNRMNVGTNRGDAHAFKLDTLLKLVDVKGTDGKTTLLHFVVQEIIRAEGYRLSGADQEEKQEQSDFREDVEFRKLGLQVVSGLSGELTNVKKAAAMDSDVLSSEVSKLAAGIAKIGEVVKLNEEAELRESSGKFSESMNGFLRKAEEEIVKIQTEESMALSMVKEITEYFHGSKEEAHPFRIFVVVRDFLSILDHVCKEVGKINDRTIVSSGRQFQPLLNPSLPSAFPGLNARRQYSSSSDNDYETSSSMV